MLATCCSWAGWSAGSRPSSGAWSIGRSTRTSSTPSADEIVGRLADAATVALGLTKWLLHSGATSPLDHHLRDEAFAMELSSRSEDFKEGLAAFREKRPPEYGGR